jgi:asparagine synthase (glutamine-hydrolysing)
MSYNFKNRIITNKKYFNLLKKSKFPKVDFKNLKYDIENVIKKNLITDTKVGIFLSGGIDSTIIAVIAKKFNDNIQAYTSFFSPNSKFKKFNEDYEYSKKICKEFNIKLNKVVIDEKNLFQKKELTNALKYLDEPNANLNFFNSFLQSKFAKRDNCKVILTGDGADEIFGGYERYQKTFISEKFSFLNLIFNKIKKINNLKNDEVAKFFYNNINLNNSKNIFSKKFYDEMIFSKKILKNSKKNIKISKIINNFDLIDWLPEESNYKLDRSSMLNSIEARVPFQDKKLIEKYFGIDFKEKIDLLSVKKPLKKLNIIPDYVKNRKKRGWLSPESIFLRHYLEKIFFKTFEKKKILKQGLLNNNEIMKIYNLHKKGSYFKKELITILIFQIWYDQLLKSF